MDIKTQPWYNANLSAAELYEAAEQWYADNMDMSTMTVQEGADMIDAYAKIRVMIRQESDKVKVFDAAWNVKEAELRSVHDVVIQAFFQDKQTAQDNDYTLPQ